MEQQTQGQPGLVERVIRFRIEREAELRALGAAIPKRQSWMDAVDYNNELLDAVEDARAKATGAA